MRYTVRPLSDRTWLNPTGRVISRFDSTWSSTLELLAREIDHLRGSNVVLEVDVAERAIRNDGMLRADARAGLPVVVAFTTHTQGDLIYRCDHYTTQWASQGPEWQHNVRAIALHLESQRAQVRWGVTGVSGGTYGGFKAIGGSTPLPGPEAPMSEHAAAEYLRSFGHAGDTQRSCWLAAVRATHPDHGGNREDWDRVAAAGRVLGLSR